MTKQRTYSISEGVALVLHDKPVRAVESRERLAQQFDDIHTVLLYKLIRLRYRRALLPGEDRQLRSLLTELLHIQSLLQ